MSELIPLTLEKLNTIKALAVIILGALFTLIIAGIYIIVKDLMKRGSK